RGALMIPLDAGVTGQYLYSDVTDRYHTSRAKSRPPSNNPQMRITAMPASQSSAAVLDRAPSAGRDARNVLLPYELGDLDLANRTVMAPMTRSRAVDGNVPNPLAATYYLQRASAGLIVTEATQVSPQGVGYIRTPGIHSAEQIAGWRKVTDAVHGAGGKI